MGKKVLIVGGVAGGASTAARLRRMDEDARLLYLNGGVHFICQLWSSYYIGGTITERRMLLVQTPERMKSMFNIEVRTQNEVIKIKEKKNSLL